jgi:hypothetical protein
VPGIGGGGVGLCCVRAPAAAGAEPHDQLAAVPAEHAAGGPVGAEGRCPVVGGRVVGGVGLPEFEHPRPGPHGDIVTLHRHPGRTAGESCPGPGGGPVRERETAPRRVSPEGAVDDHLTAGPDADDSGRLGGGWGRGQHLPGSRRGRRIAGHRREVARGRRGGLACGGCLAGPRPGAAASREPRWNSIPVT